MPTEKYEGGIKVSAYEIFIMACKIAGVIIMLPVILGLFLSLVCWGSYLLGYLMIISFWIADKLTPSKREECIYRERTYSRRKPEQPPPVYSNVNISKEESNVETKDTEP